MNIETGFKCESCGRLLEDRPPVDEDFRTPKGETRRLCGTCLEEVKATALLKHFDFGLDMITKACEPKIKNVTKILMDDHAVTLNDIICALHVNGDTVERWYSGAAPLPSYQLLLDRFLEEIEKEIARSK